MSETDRRLIEAISGAYTEGNSLGLALATGFLCLIHLWIMLLGYVLLILLSIVTWMLGFDSFLDNISVISYQGLFAWVVGASASILYRTNSAIEKWTVRGRMVFFNGVVFCAWVLIVAAVVLVLSKIFGFEIPQFENPFNTFN